jgi:hypothetical protein
MCIVCMFHCTVLYVWWSVGGTADMRTCGEKGGREGEVGGHRSRSRPFPMEQAIGWS